MIHANSRQAGCTSTHAASARGIFLAGFCLLLLSLLPALPARGENGGHQVINFDPDWKFRIGDHSGAEALDYNDTAWGTVGLPHSFSIPYFGAPSFYVGYGWYRKHFSIPDVPTDRRVFLEFDAAFQDAELFVNGQRVGEHKGGYTGFSFDITRAVQPGDNVVAVRLNNLWNPQIAPRAGEHVFSGGIYRDVRLVMTDALHVPWYGMCVTTPQVSDDAATVNVKTEVANDGPSPRSVTLRTWVLNADRQEVARMESTRTAAPGETVLFGQTSPPLAHPELWSPEHPISIPWRRRSFPKPGWSTRSSPRSGSAGSGSPRTRDSISTDATIISSGLT